MDAAKNAKNKAEKMITDHATTSLGLLVALTLAVIFLVYKMYNPSKAADSFVSGIQGGVSPMWAMGGMCAGEGGTMCSPPTVQQLAPFIPSWQMGDDVNNLVGPSHTGCGPTNPTAVMELAEVNALSGGAITPVAGGVATKNLTDEALQGFMHGLV